MRDADRRTLIACSGGADSTALVLALAGVSTKPIVAHIVHDMRSPVLAQADRDATQALSASLGLEFASASISVSDSSENIEAHARSLRYDALGTLAEQHGVRWIATGHHADDQLETMLMRLIRGTGPEGLAGVLPSRAHANCTIIRPMLEVTHADSQRLCIESGVQWCEDATNWDTTKLRSAIRASVLPTLEKLAPGAATRAANAAQLQGELVEVLRDAIRSLLSESTLSEEAGRFTLDRAVLAAARPIILAGLLREVAGESGRDRRGKHPLDQIVVAIGDQEQSSREFHLGGAVIRVQEDSVEISPAAN